MKTWKDWEPGRTYKRKSDGKLVVYAEFYGEGRLHWVDDMFKVWWGVCYVKDPSDFLLCDVEEKVIGVRRKSDREVFEVDKDGEVDMRDMGLPVSLDYVIPQSFMDVISGKFANDYELAMEVKVVAEYPHESVVGKQKPCKLCKKQGYCPWGHSKQYGICAGYEPKDKCATCAHEYEDKLPDLPPLVIIPGSEAECEAVQERAKQYGISVPRIPPTAAMLSINVSLIKGMTHFSPGPVRRAIEFYQTYFPQARILTGAEFLREFPGKK